MILTKSGYIYSFGYGVYGQLGIGNSENVFRPQKVKLYENTTISNPIFLGDVKATNEVTFKQIALGQNHSMALSRSNEVYVCGSNAQG